MRKKKTDDLLNELVSIGNFEKYRAENRKYMINQNLSDYLCSILKEKKLTKSAVIKKTELSEVYCYQIFSGLRNPSRDALICICIAMNLSLEETQNVLKVGSFGILYAKKERDSVIILGITDSWDVAQINMELYERGFETLT